MKIRKKHSCKSRNFEPQILELLNKQIEISIIIEKLNISRDIIKKVAKNNNINIDGRIKSGIMKQKAARNEYIYKMILEGTTYQKISEKTNITKQRVQQIAKSLNFSRWVQIRNNEKITIKSIEEDISKGLFYNDLKNKYNINDCKIKGMLRRNNCKILKNKRENEFINRNKTIVSEYRNGKSASMILLLDSNVISEPAKINSVGSVYSICAKQGFRKYPKVKNRMSGEVFESIKVLKLIVHLREKKHLTLVGISSYLNEKNHKTICGKIFSFSNVSNKYKLAKSMGL
jgi:predicted transcriptional regulator